MDQKENYTEPDNTSGETTEDTSGEGVPERRQRTKAERIFAVIGLVIMAGLLIWLFVCLITGSKLTMAVLFCTILYPVLLYLFFWIKKAFS